MDQVRQYLEIARKQHFWILCGVAGLAAVLAYFLSTGKLTAEFKTAASKVQKTEQDLTQIEFPHPNDESVEQTNQQSDQLAQQVLEQWNKLYEQQSSEVYSKWPEGLTAEFMREVPKFDNPNYRFSNLDLPRRYQNVVRQEISRLARIVDADPDVGTSASGTSSRARFGDDGTGNPIQPLHRVKWDQLADIRQSFDWELAPSLQLVKYAQEELWVYDALCKTIAKVNEGSTGPHNAPIKEIGEMAIAYAVFSGNPAGRTWLPTATGAPGIASAGRVGGGTAGGVPDLKSRGKSSGADRGFEDGARGAGAAAGAAAAPVDPDEIWRSYRYANENGLPLLSTELETAAPPEFNLMPFRLKLTVDPRSIDDLLLAMRNCVLPLQVREFRVNPESGGGGGSYGRSSSRSYGYDSTGSGQASRARTVNLEVSGLAYLVKKPDPAKIGVNYQPGGGGAAAAASASTSFDE